MARAISDCAECGPAPRRLTLGRDAFTNIRTALTARIAALDAQKAIAFSTEVD